ncbi:MAG: hypothetical protein ACLTOP_09340 [Collinsella phocaeensis]
MMTVHYSDSEFCPANFEAYRKRVIGETELSLDAAKRILRNHGVKGRSKMDAYEARATAEEVDPKACRASRAEAARLYRWLVAHGLELTYGELAKIEAEAGVEVVPGEANRGTYASYEDVEKVYTAGEAHRGQVISTSIRLPLDTERDEVAADKIIKALGDVFDIPNTTTYSGKYGGRFLSADVLVPIR